MAVSLNQGKAGSDPQVTITTDEKHTSHTTQTNYPMILDDIKKKSSTKNEWERIEKKNVKEESILGRVK